MEYSVKINSMVEFTAQGFGEVLPFLHTQYYKSAQGLKFEDKRKRTVNYLKTKRLGVQQNCSQVWD